MKIVRVRQTCFSCPSQWDVWNERGDYLNLRYRYGVGTVTRELYDGIMDEVDRFTFGDSMGGVISLEDFCALAGLELSDHVEYLTME